MPNDQSQTPNVPSPPVPAPPVPMPRPTPTDVPPPEPESNKGATEEAVGDTSGPGVGFNNEPKKVKDKGGVASS